MELNELNNNVMTCSIQTKRDVRNYLNIQVGHAYSIVNYPSLSWASLRPPFTVKPFD
jgi:hypothetical protein